MIHKDFNYKDLLRRVQVPPNKKVSLKSFDPAYVPRELSKEESEQLLAQGVQLLSEYQDKLYAQDCHSLLIIFQALDAAGKDGTIKHVMSGINPQGCEVHSFKAPNAEELDHDYLWRAHLRMPERGHIGIFNRSYYEETLVVRVHPQFLAGQRLPGFEKGTPKNIWQQRYRQINDFERHLTENGTRILKFYLNVSKEEQKSRFLQRIAAPEKNWKFRAADVDERAHWKQYREAYEDVFRYTSTKEAPWYVIPADNKWFTRVAVASIIYHTLRDMNPSYPKLSAEELAGLDVAKNKLEAE
jgi:PPK2 family polyphosphate:nucleotide phosphotransferase